ncbi:MAG: PTS sugar transporter subunit IIA [Planctomycetota bacterium]|nr:PTS sugar transporter subunit IIA [Planctomycetota bacterium]
MKLSDIIPDGGIGDELQATEKEAVIRELVDLLVKAGRVDGEASKKVIKALMDREELGSTGIGSGVAVPHAKHDSISDLVCAFGRSKKGVNFDALDGEPVFVFFLLLSSKGASGSHLEALAFISRLVRDEKFVKFLRDAKDAKDIRDVLNEADQTFGGS